MFLTSHTKRSLLLITFIAGLSLLSSFSKGLRAQQPIENQSAISPAIIDLIYGQKYDDAITTLEEVLERDPKNAEALTDMATANLYLHRNFTFVVTHSHEKFNTDYIADYCRGWLHLRKNGIEFVPIEGTHGFKLRYADIEEFKINRLSKRAFHIKFNQKSQNFYTRTNSEFEPLLIIALHKSFTRN